MIGPVEQAKAVWFDAHQDVCHWLEPFLEFELARRVASRAAAKWVRCALDGEQGRHGPYEGLFLLAFGSIAGRSGSVDLPSWDELHEAIPYDTKLLPYQLCKLYTDIWQAGQLLKWDHKTSNRVSRALAEVYPVTQWQWEHLDPEQSHQAAHALASCAFDVLSTHVCEDCPICLEHATRWENADACTEAWFTGRRLARKE